MRNVYGHRLSECGRLFEVFHFESGVVVDTVSAVWGDVERAVVDRVAGLNCAAREAAAAE